MNNLKSALEKIVGNTQHFVALTLLILAAFAIAYFAETQARKREIKQTGATEDMFSTRKIAIS